MFRAVAIQTIQCCLWYFESWTFGVKEHISQIQCVLTQWATYLQVQINEQYFASKQYSSQKNKMENYVQETPYLSFIFLFLESSVIYI